MARSDGYASDLSTTKLHVEPNVTVNKPSCEGKVQYQQSPVQNSRLEHIHITRIDDVKLFDRRRQAELFQPAQNLRSRQSDVSASLTASLRKSITALNPLFDFGGRGSGARNSCTNKLNVDSRYNSRAAVPAQNAAGFAFKNISVSVTESHLILTSAAGCKSHQPHGTTQILHNQEIEFEVWLSHSLIAQCDRLPACIVSDNNNRFGFPIHIRCKHFVSFTLVLNREEDAFKLHGTLLRLASPWRLQELPCFTRTDNAPAVANGATAVQDRKHGFATFDMVAEWSRQQLPTRHWRISNANRSYLLSETYPEVLVLPADASGDVIRGSARFRSKNRLPALTYFHRQSEGAIIRCSQPLSGFNMRSPDDETFFELIKNCCPRSRSEQTLWLVDVRPKLNALFNRAQGKGYESESNYVGMRAVFYAVENIHVMRASYEKLYDLFDVCVAEQHQEQQRGAAPSSDSTCVSVKTYYERLKSCSWLRHVQLLLKAACFVAEKCAAGYSVVVHCSDGWDRTAQVCALAQLLIDPYYRTIEGFLALIAKDWLAFGHKFTDRCGHLRGPLDKSTDDDAEAVMTQPLLISSASKPSIDNVAAIMSFAALSASKSIDEERNETFYGDENIFESMATPTRMVGNIVAEQNTADNVSNCDAEYDKCEALSANSDPVRPTSSAACSDDVVVIGEFEDPLRAFAAEAAASPPPRVVAAQAEQSQTSAVASPPVAYTPVAAATNAAPSTVAVSSSVTTASTVSNHEQSPIFLQFLDCVYQLLVQNTHEYEFNERLLLALQQAAYSAEYETFVGNSEKQRVELAIESTAPSSSGNLPKKSFWHHVQSNWQQFVNPVYSPTNFSSKLLVDGGEQTPVSLPPLLAVDTDIQRIELWFSLYARCDDWLTDEESSRVLVIGGKRKSREAANGSRGGTASVSQQLSALREYVKSLSSLMK